MEIIERPQDTHHSSVKSATHVHHIRPLPRRKLSTTLRALVAFGQDGGNYFSLKPNPHSGIVEAQSPPDHTDLRTKIKLSEEYGQCEDMVGKGGYGTVYVCRKKVFKEIPDARNFAMKKDRREPEEEQNAYRKRLLKEFLLASALQHRNIVETIDLLEDEKGSLSTIMEFCAGGDLHTLVKEADHLNAIIADCYFKQTISGLHYLHQSGVVHRDLKLENLLLTMHGCLKIADFGYAESFQPVGEAELVLTTRRCGSGPYIAPEEYLKEPFDPRGADIWSLGIIYLAMRTGTYFWERAQRDRDEHFDNYILGRKSEEGYGPIEKLERVSTNCVNGRHFTATVLTDVNQSHCRNVIYSILDHVPSRRLKLSQILKAKWVRDIKLCAAAEQPR